MPSKRTNDSVDRILEELSHEQAERGIRDSVTDRQVDAILQSLGHGSMEESSGGGSALGPIQKEDLPDITLGKGNNFNTEDRFSTAVLDDLLGDLPSMRAAKKNKPGPAAPARRPASVPEPRRMPEVEPKVEKQNNIQTVQQTQPVRSEPVPQPARPAPAQTAPQQPAPQPEPGPADATSGDTTRTSIIKAFLGRMVPEADSKYLDEGKKDFTNFFGTSVAVVPDDMKSEQERQQTPKKKGLFGFGYATDTGEFEPINVSVSGRVGNQSTQQLEEQLPRLQDALPQDEPDEMELREQEPPRHYAAKKKGFFASLFGGKKHDVYDELESYDPYEGEPDTAPVEKFVTCFPDTAASVEAFYDDQVLASVPLDPEGGTVIRGDPYPAYRIEAFGLPVFPHEEYDGRCKRAQAERIENYTNGSHSGSDFIRRFRAN